LFGTDYGANYFLIVRVGLNLLNLRVILSYLGRVSSFVLFYTSSSIGNAKGIVPNGALGTLVKHTKKINKKEI
jgi:hypothetical protein